MSDEEIEKISEQTALYKKIRPLVQGGKFYRLLSPFEGNQTAWMTVSQDEKEFLVITKDFPGGSLYQRTFDRSGGKSTLSG